MRATIFQVSAITGALVECVATCMCRVVSRMLGDLNPRFSTVIDAFVGTSLVVAGRRMFLYSSYILSIFFTTWKDGRVCIVDPWYTMYFSFQLHRRLLQSCTGDFFKIRLSGNLVSGARDGLLDWSVHWVYRVLARVPYAICTKFRSTTRKYRYRVFLDRLQ